MISIIVIRVWGEARQTTFDIPDRAIVISYEPLVEGHDSQHPLVSCLTYYMTEYDFKKPH